jgi:lysozyme
MLYLSRPGFDFIKRWEGCRLRSYKDGGGVWTVGYGHTKNAGPGQVISQQTAEDLLMEDVWYFEVGVRDLVKLALSQCQFDALVSFAFNVGLDQDADDKAEGLGDSTLLRKLNNKDIEGAASEFLKWNKDNGKVIKGLTNRRIAERLLFLEGDYGLNLG